MSYAGKIEELIAERDALRQRVNDEQEKNIQLKLAALKARAKLTAERAISDKLAESLNAIVTISDRDHAEWIEAHNLLAELAAMRKVEKE